MKVKRMDNDLYIFDASNLDPDKIQTAFSFLNKVEEAKGTVDQWHPRAYSIRAQAIDGADLATSGDTWYDHLQAAWREYKPPKPNLPNQTCQIISTKPSHDGKIRSAEVLYRNSSEMIDQTTTRAARQLVRNHSINELDIVQELGEVATIYDLKYKLQHQ